VIIPDDVKQLLVFYETSNHPEKYLNAYQDSKGIWTIGIGATYMPDGTAVKQGDQITLPECYTLMDDLLSPVFSFIQRIHPNILTYQQSALGSFIYNIGIGNYGTSHVKKYILEGKPFSEIKLAFLMWDLENGEFSAWQYSRRTAEADYFASGNLVLYQPNSEGQPEIYTP
jgi:lysozyme